MEEGDTTQGPPASSNAQLYNLDSDPGEIHNVAVQHPDLVERMSGELAQIAGLDGPKGFPTK